MTPNYSMESYRGLYVPESMRRQSPEVIETVINGCGPAGWKKRIRRGLNKILFLSVKPACDIHDWMYHEGENVKDKAEADRVFLNNTLRIIERRTKPGILRNARSWIAVAYYGMVKFLGGPAFWEGKTDGVPSKGEIIDA